MHFIGRVFGDLTGMISFAWTLLGAAGWCQHFYTCVSRLELLFLAVGTLIFPVGIIHGWGIWLGIWS